MTIINGFEFTDLQIEYANDVRRSLMATADMPLSDRDVEGLLGLRVWSVWGYKRFFDMLRLELHMPLPRALRWCCIALARGHESHEIYADIYSLLFPEITMEIPQAVVSGGAQ